MEEHRKWNRAFEQGRIDPKKVLEMHNKVIKSSAWEDLPEEKALRDLAEVYQHVGLEGRFLNAQELGCSTNEASEIYTEARNVLSQYGFKCRY